MTDTPVTEAPVTERRPRCGRPAWARDGRPARARDGRPARARRGRAGRTGAAPRLVPVLVAGLAAAHAACATAPAPAPLDAVRGDGGVHWDGLRIGMTAREVRARLGAPLPALRSTADRCGDAVATLEREGRQVRLGFTHAGEEGTLHTITLDIPPGTPREDIVRWLRESIDGLRYQPSPYEPDLPEARNPKPLYVAGEPPSVGVLVGFEEGRVWISALECME